MNEMNRNFDKEIFAWDKNPGFKEICEYTATEVDKPDTNGRNNKFTLFFKYRRKES
jgi:hypothetical protein